MKITVPLVGTHFATPEAKALLKTLELGTQLTLRAEPTNPYDPDAIQVLHIDQNNYELVLGHVGASQGKPCALFQLPGTEELWAHWSTPEELAILHVTLTKVSATDAKGRPQESFALVVADDFDAFASEGV
jgi:hypothetical protein